MSVHVTTEHLTIAERFVRKAHAHDGLAPIDLDRFWEDQEIAIGDPFGDIPQVPLGAICNLHCVYAEVGVPEDIRRYGRDVEWRLSLNKAFNDKAERIVGRRLLSEARPNQDQPSYPSIKALHDVFEMENIWDETSQCYWLHSSAQTPDELTALLDRVDDRSENLRDFILPPEWDATRDRLMEQGIKPPRYREQRGPVTFAMSLYGVENLIFLILDQPDLARRLRDTILKVMLEKTRIHDEEAGDTLETAPHGFGFADDNCVMLNAEMYEFFGYPILKGIWDRYSPDPKDRRHQHSDSDMGHLLPVLGRLDLTSANFGPNVMADEIREHLPNAVIRGVLAPFVYSRNEEVNMVGEFLRDFEMTREKRGLVFATAGSINNGTRLTGMRLLMAAIQEFGRYDQ